MKIADKINTSSFHRHNDSSTVQTVFSMPLPWTCPSHKTTANFIIQKHFILCDLEDSFPKNKNKKKYFKNTLKIYWCYYTLGGHLARIM